MGFDRKYGQVTTERGDIPDDEPLFIIRGKDAAAPAAIRAYAEAAYAAGAALSMVENIRERAEQVAAWQKDNPARVSVPTTMPGQIRERTTDA